VFLSGALGNDRQAEQKAQIILAELDRLSTNQMAQFLDLTEDWFAARQ